nr:MAG TPA: hypothetical protein [Bacteriophage sp.]
MNSSLRERLPASVPTILRGSLCSPSHKGDYHGQD